MRRATELLILPKPSLISLFSKPSFLLFTRPNSSSSSSSSTQCSVPHLNLTPDELKRINLLLPRLCQSNHLHEAIRLIDTVLITNPPLHSISLSILIDRLSEEPNMTHSMSLLNRLKHNPITHPFLLHINKLLITSYLKKQKNKEAMKILSWVSRPDSLCIVDTMFYRIMVKGLCRNFETMEALKVVKAMVKAKVVVGDDLRNWVYKSLLREARIKEAIELNKALSCELVDGSSVDFQRVGGLLDQMISNWTE